MIRRRYWWQITDKIEEAHFVWTQLKISECFKSQKKYKSGFVKLKGRPSTQQSKESDMNKAVIAGNDWKLWERYSQNNSKIE